MKLTSSIFQLERLPLPPHGEEFFVRGGHSLFSVLPQALQGIRQIAVIGFGSQARPQAQNLRDALRDTSIRVKVGLRKNSSSASCARDAGFTEANGTLGEMGSTIAESDMVLLLISDDAQARVYPEVFSALRPGTTLGLAHGFLLLCLQHETKFFPTDIDVVAVCPKGMGRFVRPLFLAGKGFNAAIAVEQDVSTRALDRALAWATGIGCQNLFFTGLRHEGISNMLAERGVVLAAVHGLSEALYDELRAYNREPGREALAHSSENITGPVSAVLRSTGPLGLYEGLDHPGRSAFARIYTIAYPLFFEIFEELYEALSTGDEIKDLIQPQDASRTAPRHPLWVVREGERPCLPQSVHPWTAGLYTAAIMAQMDLLVRRGHPLTEAWTESFSDAVYALNPVMREVGADAILQGCSFNARMGALKWSKRFFATATEKIFPRYHALTKDPCLDSFLRHPHHRIFDILKPFGPDVQL